MTVVTWQEGASTPGESFLLICFPVTAPAFKDGLYFEPEGIRAAASGEAQPRLQDIVPPNPQQGWALCSTTATFSGGGDSREHSSHPAVVTLPLPSWQSIRGGVVHFSQPSIIPESG